MQSAVYAECRDLASYAECRCATKGKLLAFLAIIRLALLWETL
jgi:hypothetical protein